jgi:hypothetical protein
MEDWQLSIILFFRGKLYTLAVSVAEVL